MYTKRGNYRIQLFAALLLLAPLAVPPVSSAQTLLPAEPINIEANNARIIEKEGKSIYSGNVVLLQGATRVTADKLTVLSRDGKLFSITAEGKPVTYVQKNQPKSADITAQAEQVNYFAEEKRVVLLNNAKLTQGRTVFSGNRIEYNAETEVVTANQSESGKTRVQVIIHPEKKSDSPKQPALP